LKNTEALKEPTLLRNEVEPISAQDSRLKKVPLNDLTLGNKCFNTPRNTQKHQPKTGAGLKKQYTISPPRKFFFAPALTRQGARGSGFARAIAPVPTNFHGGFTALSVTKTGFREEPFRGALAYWRGIIRYLESRS